MTVKTEDPIDFLASAADACGVSCATVSDGHVLIFKKSKLEELLRSIGDRDQVVIFVKRPDMDR